MRPLIAAAFLAALAAACSAFNGPATTPAPGTCGGHLDCGAAGCCDEAQDGDAAWVCGSGAFDGCPAGSCCYVGGSEAPGDLGAPRASKLRPRR